MPPHPQPCIQPLARVLLLLAAAPALLLVAACRKPAHPPPTHARRTLPPIILWAWQEPEDLQSIDTHHLGVASLVETVLLSDHLTAQPRHQPLHLASGTRVVAVVRIEANRGFRDTPDLRSALAHHLAEVADLPAIAGLQLDFDAVVSQQPFYTAVLGALRPLMPPSVPLSITALVNWCRSPSWLTSLPVDDAIPMFFRMGGPAVHSPNAPNPLHPAVPFSLPAPAPRLGPPCQHTIGLSTDESWPQLPPYVSKDVTLYLFSPAPWTPGQIRTLNTFDPATLTR